MNVKSATGFIILCSAASNELCMEAYKTMKGYTQRHATIKH